VEEAVIHLECKVAQIVDLPPRRSIFIADVVATRVQDEVCDDNGRLIVDSLPFFGMTAGSGEFYTIGQKVGHIGMSVGRRDIRY
jgi:flavin reductase (DIM6/NTAB) family NADH-FMN oxidoreductase RutF